MKAVPVIRMDEQAAKDAFEAHAALLKAQAAAPFLRTLPSFTMAKQDTYEAFFQAFWRL